MRTTRTLVLAGAAWALLCHAAQAGPAEDTRKMKEDLARVAAMERLRTFGGDRLTTFATDPRVEVRRAAVRAIGRLQEEKGRATLVKALEDADAGVRREAAFALGQHPGAGTTELVARFDQEADAPVRRALVEAVGKQARSEDVPFLARWAADADVEIRRHARVGLGLLAKRREGQLTDVTAAQVAEWLKDAEPRGRFGAAYLLMRAESLNDAPARDAARACASDAEAEIRAACVRALGRFGAESGEALAAAAGDADWRVRVEAARAMGKSGAVEALAGRLRVAAEALAADQLDVATAALHPVVAALDAALEQAEPRPFADAAKALFEASKTKDTLADAATRNRALGLSHLNCRAAALLDRQTGKLEHLKSCGAPDFPAEHREPLVVQVYARLPPAQRLKALDKMYGGATIPGQVAVLSALEAEKEPKSVSKLLLQALGSQDPSVVAAAAEVAGKLHVADAEAPLIAAYQRFMGLKEYETVQSVFAALGELKSESAARVLEDHTFDANRAIRAAAMEALKKIRGHEGRASIRVPAPPPAALDSVNPASAEPSPVRAAVLHTSKGPLRLALLAEAAPETVKSFVRLAEKGFYDNLKFHRVVPDFVAQGGDPRGDGWGGPGYTLGCEINPEPYETGTVGMAHAGKDTGGSQFFVTHGPQPHLNGVHTVFGRIADAESQAVADALTVGDVILRVELSRKP